MKLVHQLRCGVDGLCVLGGTGESLSLTAQRSACGVVTRAAVG